MEYTPVISISIPEVLILPRSEAMGRRGDTGPPGLDIGMDMEITGE